MELSRLEEIDARVAYLSELFQAGEITDDDDLKREVLSLSQERDALLAPVPSAGLSGWDRADRLVTALGAFCESWRSYQTGR